ncbi:MAG: 2-oxoacid:acceptor oxidoreductase family protein [Anaerolineae bacterium]
MGKMIEIRWHGRGGQGVVTAGKLLAETALEAGQHFQAFPDYGPERSGAPIRAFTRLSDEPIRIHSQIEEPDVVLVLDPTIIGAVDVTEGLKEDGVLIVNTPQGPAEIRSQLDFHGGRVYTVDASHIALEELSREITNTPMLGALARATGLFKVEELVEQIRRRFEDKLSPQMVEANVRAIERAAGEVQEG